MTLSFVFHSSAKQFQGKDLKRDIAFLVDGSDSTKGGFQSFCNFVYNIIANLTIGVNESRIAIIQYSNVAVANFHLNSFQRKEDVLNAVKSLTQKGGRPLNMGSALWYVNNNIFTVTSGSRKHEGVAQILILLTGGKSKDSIDEPLNALEQAGVSIIAIGTQNSDVQELPTISDEIRSFIVEDYNDLSDINNKVVAVVKKDLSKGMTEKKKLVIGESYLGHK